MSIQDQLGELEARRNAALREVDDQVTQFEHYLRIQYSPENVVRRHLGAAMGIAATLGVVASGSSTDLKGGLLRALVSWLRGKPRGRTEPSDTGGESTVRVDGANGQVRGSGPGAVHTQPADAHPILDMAEPILRNLIVGVAEVIPWRGLMGRVLEKRHQSTDADNRDTGRGNG